MNRILFLLTLFCSVSVFAQSTDPTFDLRDVEGTNYVTSVKSQNGGTCWTHGVMASIEGNLLMSGLWATTGLTGEPDLSEYHLDWWNGFNSEYNQDTMPDDGTGLDVHYGGDYRVTSAYLARGEGAIADTTNYDAWYNNAPHRFAERYNYFYVRDIDWYTIGDNLERIQTIKNKIVEYGVMGTCMAYDGQFISSYIHYQPPSSEMEPNHAVAIVGWNDNKETGAPEPGAWLVKNSWGSNWGNSGYFWISYYDKWAGRHPEMGAVSLYNAVEPFFDTIYYHDYHGWRDTKTDVTTAMNAFEAQDSLLIKAISFYTAADSVAYTASVYGAFENEELSDLLGQVSGAIPHTGFHTIDLLEEILVFGGDRFFIELQLDKGGQPFDRTSEVPVLLCGDSKKTIVRSTSRRGQSYYRDADNQWVDFYDEGEPLWVNTGNFCMKAIADFYTGPLVGNTNSKESTSTVKVYPQPANNAVNFVLTTNNMASGNIQVFNTAGQLVETYSVSGESHFSIAVNQLPSGVYFYRVPTQHGLMHGKFVKN
ncbi:MAG: lectin like domain-containing protein [Salinivirgaceae bacterium]|jgi:C1A family cysteine protease|nr:lectin like domain-containing protein [Salinivirgaceae bacterium]